MRGKRHFRRRKEVLRRVLRFAYETIILIAPIFGGTPAIALTRCASPPEEPRAESLTAVEVASWEDIIRQLR
jgi:hypothetical protein